MKKWIGSLGLLAAAAVIATGCGGGKDKESSPSASQAASGNAGAANAITLKASNFEFDQKEIKVKKGDTVTITLENAQGNHAVKFDGYDQEAKGGKTISFTADKAGEFKYYCSIMCGKGHADMVGKLIVE